MAVVTVPPLVTSWPLISREAIVSPPVSMAMLPCAISLSLAESDPSGSVPRAGSPASATSSSPSTAMVGSESSASTIVTVAVSTSPSPSVME